MVKEYLDHLNIEYSFKTYEVEKSHLKKFFEFLTTNFPQIQKIRDLNNDVVIKFIQTQKEVINIRGTKNTNATINHRVQALEKMLKYHRDNGKYQIPDNVTTKYDYLREPKKYPKYESKEEIFRVIIAIKEALKDKKYEEEFQELCVLLILIDSGRRVHEVLTLKYNCLRKGRVVFHKCKHRKTTIPIVGETTLNAIRIAKEYSRKINKMIYSKYDQFKVRRLFPSKNTKGRTLLSRDSVDQLFKLIQIENSIVDNSGKPMYTLHDNKRNFVTNLLAAKVTPEEIAQYLNQNTNSLLPYEVNNEFAITTLKSVEERGLLIGESDSNQKSNEQNPILELIQNVDIVSRHKENLLHSINNTKDTVPLFLGICVDNTNVEVCGDLVCMACEEYRTDNIEEFEKYAIRLFRFIYQNRRHNSTKKIENQLYKALENIYLNIENTKIKDYEVKIKRLKKEARRRVENDKRAEDGAS
ncbi:tyrosine-type recombinase/integrase [Brassicibacter mesophilus]|uniref:tyrosine-type recombinase/integrase n=1 Tax=Brassicibacter mesophilus TaxID=745119 RepID=UPI003D1E9742